MDERKLNIFVHSYPRSMNTVVSAYPVPSFIHPFLLSYLNTRISSILKYASVSN